MSPLKWMAFEGYGQPFQQTIEDCIGIARKAGSYGDVIDMRVRPRIWEFACDHYGRTRPVQFEESENMAALVTFIEGRRVRLFAVPTLENDVEVRLP